MLADSRDRSASGNSSCDCLKFVSYWMAWLLLIADSLQCGLKVTA